MELNNNGHINPIVMIFIFIVLVVCIVFTSGTEKKLIVAKKIHKQEISCKSEDQLNKEMYLKLSRATKKYCSANWFDGSEVCQHLETECFNYCIKTTEKNCRVECESKI